jgi:NAD(P)H-dependent flavin oxidoreductase YrpB (nitropropane dioxygenase family)
MALLPDLAVSLPVLAAPMAGGPGTPALVMAAAQVGSLGLLAGGYKTPEALAEQIALVRAAGVPFGVNLFAPNPVPVDLAAYREYARLLQPEAERYGVTLPEQPVEDDDAWAAKVELLRDDPVPVVSFTFGLPSAEAVAALRRAGTLVWQTVTSADEARAAEALGVDGLAVQAATASGHWGTFTPSAQSDVVPLPELVARIRAATRLPIVAAGGVGTARDAAEAVHAGADAVAVGTALLRTEESGASAVHRAALADPAFPETVQTRAFTGRPARGLRNRFIDSYQASAPLGYPALHHLTSGLRRAAADAGDPGAVHLWAGTGFRHAAVEPAGRTLERLAADLG